MQIKNRRSQEPFGSETSGLAGSPFGHSGDSLHIQILSRICGFCQAFVLAVLRMALNQRLGRNANQKSAGVISGLQGDPDRAKLPGLADVNANADFAYGHPCAQGSS